MRLKFSKIKIIYLILLVPVTVFLLYFGYGVVEYIKFKNVAKAVSGFPWIEAGKITMVREPCVLDTPTNSPVTCGISCPEAASTWLSVCTGVIEIHCGPSSCQQGSLFITPPVSFVYTGGGNHPVVGMDFIAGGFSNLMPKVIGLPGPVGFKVQKARDWFYRYIIASFKN